MGAKKVQDGAGCNQKLALKGLVVVGKKGDRHVIHPTGTNEADLGLRMVSEANAMKVDGGLKVDNVKDALVRKLLFVFTKDSGEEVAENDICEGVSRP